MVTVGICPRFFCYDDTKGGERMGNVQNRRLGDWADLVQREMAQPYFEELKQFVDRAYQETTVYPARENIWNAFIHTPFHRVKCVILGQDPYHGPNQAHGLSFSVMRGVAIPPSLRNMYKELQTDLGCEIPKHGDLTKWTEQGVLLLNTVLTVEAGKAGSHRGHGWETFTDAVIRELGKRPEPIVFLLWGNDAKSKQKWIAPHHVVFTSVHPSPLSAHRGFFGSRPFSKTNEVLSSLGEQPIDWCIE